MKNILLVEDDDLVATSLMHFLRRKGHCVDLARNGVEGLDASKHKDYDIVLTDIRMPKMNGIDMVAQMCDTSKKIFMTGFSELVSQVVDYEIMRKPFGVDELVDKLELEATP